MPDEQFYYLRNIQVHRGRSYASISDALPKIPAKIRLGPPLTKEGHPRITLFDQGYLGIYVRGLDHTFPPKGHSGRARTTLQRAESELEKIVRILKEG